MGVIAPGITVTGDSGREWRIGAELGRGGTAIVFKALSDDGVDAAAKVLSAHRFPVDAGMRRRFDREGALLSSFDSRHVLRVLDRAVLNGEPILLLEKLDASLYATLSAAAPGRPPLSSAVTWLWQALLGVAAMHQADMVHRDLSPKNLLLRADGELVVGDFGTVRHLDDETISDQRAALGSLIYISRQQFENSHTATPADDVYSLGQIAYELLTGWRPVGNVPALSAVRPDLPPALCALVEHMRAPQSDDRFADAGEVVAELRHVALSARARHGVEHAHGMRLLRRQRKAAVDLRGDGPAADALATFLRGILMFYGPVRLATEDLPGRVRNGQATPVPASFAHAKIPEGIVPRRVLALLSGGSIRLQARHTGLDPSGSRWEIDLANQVTRTLMLEGAEAYWETSDLAILDRILGEAPEVALVRIADRLNADFSAKSFTEGARCGDCGAWLWLFVEADPPRLSRAAVCACEAADQRLRCSICGGLMRAACGAECLATVMAQTCDCGDVWFDPAFESAPAHRRLLRPSDVREVFESFGGSAPLAHLARLRFDLPGERRTRLVSAFEEPAPGSAS